MADQDKIGTPWTDGELDAIIADYFDMLSSELSQRPYVKAHHSATLMNQLGRTHRSVEFKHQNTSAVLEELGLPWILGYKPKRNYQNAIFDAIDRHLSSHGDVAGYEIADASRGFADDGAVFTPPPPLEPQRDRPLRLEHLIRKFDPVERDFRNRALGKAGEQFVIDVEQTRLIRMKRPDLARTVRWVAAEDGDGAGYDILSFEHSGTQRLIEVKTTNGAAKTPFFLSRNEHQTAIANSESWRLYRVHLFAQSPRIFSVAPPLDKVLSLCPEMWRASFN